MFMKPGMEACMCNSGTLVVREEAEVGDSAGDAYASQPGVVSGETRETPPQSKEEARTPSPEMVI